MERAENLTGKRGLRRSSALMAALLGLGVACGARTPLEETSTLGLLCHPGDDGGAGTAGAGGTSAAVDAGHDARLDGAAGDASPDAIADASHDAVHEGTDAAADVTLDAPDAAPFDCVDAGITYIYLIGSDNTLWSFYPPSQSFTAIGTITCESVPGATPFSMGVDRHGEAYVVFTDGSLFRVDTSDAACAATPFQPFQHGFVTFGMGFSASGDGISEKLYVAENAYQSNPHPPSLGLGIIDTKTYQLSFVDKFDPTPASAGIELTGSGMGKLYGFSLHDVGTGGTVIEIDKKTAKILSSTDVPVGAPDSALAFAFWGGAFYIFTSTDHAFGTDVNRYDPADGSTTLVLQHPATIVGAGVSTCAPL